MEQIESSYNEEDDSMVVTSNFYLVLVKNLLYAVIISHQNLNGVMNEKQTYSSPSGHIPVVSSNFVQYISGL